MTAKVLWELARDAGHIAGIGNSLRMISTPHLCPSYWQPTGSDPVLARARLEPNHRTTPRLQAELQNAVNDRLGIEPDATR